ncbi:MAG: carboxypeptidase regulatory-like domain-containing protein, partial [Chloroflexi bacterium]|nr:carboxypeptidase regulatory-like domain-containing protein [Chloroflexota bacterium]
SATAFTLPVTMTVNAPATWGKLTGTITGLTFCDSPGLPLENASVHLASDTGYSATVQTDANGIYTRWLDAANSPLSLTVSASGFAPVSASGITISPGQTTTANFDLRPVAPCLNADPPDVAVTVDMGAVITSEFTLTNTGAGDTPFQIREHDEGLQPTAATSRPVALASYSGPGTNHAAAFPFVPSPGHVRSGSTVLIIQDVYPWGYDSIQQVLNASGISYDQVTSSSLPTVNLAAYNLVIVPSVQPASFYQTWNDNLARIEDYVTAGGYLWLSVTTFDNIYPKPLAPGGAASTNDFDAYNLVVEPSHPWVAGVPGTIYGNWASHDSFTQLASGTLVVVRAQSSSRPTLVDYRLGAGRVLASGMTLEFAWVYGWNAAPILRNSLLDMHSGAGDVPWLSEDPSAGTLTANGGSQIITVTFDASVPEVDQPGNYHAEVQIRGDDPYSATAFTLPVTMTVNAPATWGKLTGTITGLSACDIPGAPLANAAVHIQSEDGYSVTVTTDANGLYSRWLDAANSPLSLTVSADGFVTQTATGVPIVGGQTTTHNVDLRLSAPCLSAAPETAAATLVAGETATTTVTLTNSGAVEATFRLREQGSGAPPRAGPFQQSAFRVPEDQQNAPTTTALLLPGLPSAAPLAAGDVIQNWNSGLSAAWGIALDYDDDTVWVSSPAPSWSGGNNTLYEYTPSGQPTGRAHPYTWLNQYGPADAAYHPGFGTLWVMDVGTDDCIHDIHPVTGVTGNVICPGFAVSQRGLAYDPSTDTFYAGSWNDGMVYHFDSSGQMLDEVFVGLAIAGLAYNPDTQHLFVIVNNDPNPVYVLDAADNYAILGQFYVSQGFGPYAGAGLEMDCDGHLWAVDQTTETAYQFESGEATLLCGGDVPWLNAAPEAGTVAPDGGQQALTFTFDSANMEPGEYTATVKVVSNDALRPIITIPVTMTVVPVPYGLTLDPLSDAKSGYPGANVTYTLTLTNTGSMADTYDVDLTGNNWSTVVPGAVGPLEPGESATVEVVVIIPPDASDGATDTAILIFTSLGDPTVWASSTLTTTATASTPPTSAVRMKIRNVCEGPAIDPIAAISLTSPPPIPRIRNS